MSNVAPQAGLFNQTPYQMAQRPGVPKPSMAYLASKKAAAKPRAPLPANSADAPGSATDRCFANLCCQEVRSRDDVSTWMLSNNADAEPSLLQRVCLLQCGPEARTPSTIIKVPELAGLAGITVQSDTGQGSTGSLQTLKWAIYDEETRVARMQVFGGWGGHASVGWWTEPADERQWNCLINVARLCNYTYEFRFSTDYRHADIYIQGNLTGGCFPLIPGLPCVPAWFTIPSCCIHFEMEQTDFAGPGQALDGKNWIRKSYCCGKAFQVNEYELAQVYDSDGNKNDEYFDRIEQAPMALLISR